MGGRHRTAAATVLVGGEQTDGTYTLIRFVLQDGYGPSLHVHHQEDELFYLLSGRMYAECAGRQVTVEPGGCLLLPRGLPHGFVITDGPCDMIQITNPAGFETCMAEVGPTFRSAEVALAGMVCSMNRPRASYLVHDQSPEVDFATTRPATS